MKLKLLFFASITIAILLSYSLGKMIDKNLVENNPPIQIVEKKSPIKLAEQKTSKTLIKKNPPREPIESKPAINLAKDKTPVILLDKKQLVKILPSTKIEPQAEITSPPLDLSPKNTPSRKLPIHKKENWEKNAVKFTENKNLKYKIAIVIDDLGLNHRLTKKVIHLNGPINLSFLPYGENIQSLVNLGKKHRHEIMLHLPMEPLSQTIDPGPNVIKAQMPESRVKELLAANMNQFEGYVGINNHMGSKATVSKKTIKPLLQMIKQEGLIFLDSRTNCDSVCPEVSDQIDFPILSRDVFLDNVAKPKQIKRQLAQLEKIAKQKQFAIGIGHPHQATTTALKEWSKDLHERGIELVPISFIMKQKKTL